MKERFQLAGLLFQVRRSPRRKTLGLTVDRGGELVIHAPDAAPHHELEQWTRKKLLWVYRKLAAKEELQPRSHKPEYVSGETYYYLGRCYRLVIVDRQEQPLMFDGRRFTLRRDARSAAEGEFRKWYIATGTEWITERVKVLTRKSSTSPSRIQLRDLGFRWGSCGKRDAIFFNWRLLQLPVRLTDYVICHELVHLRIPNHSPAFWAFLDGVQPDWRQRKNELAAQARTIHWFEDVDIGGRREVQKYEPASVLLQRIKAEREAAPQKTRKSSGRKVTTRDIFKSIP
jgi:predicted metal-dependent hydrolase